MLIQSVSHDSPIDIFAPVRMTSIRFGHPGSAQFRIGPGSAVVTPISPGFRYLTVNIANRLAQVLLFHAFVYLVAAISALQGR